MPLARVDARQAGADALGILVPPGSRTIVILRPRTLGWDLLPVRWNGDPAVAPTFCTFGRDEAALIARRLGAFLEASDAAGEHAVETLGRDRALQIWLRFGEHAWLVCSRAPGEAYRPVLFADADAARAAAERLAATLHPGPARVQKYYFNTQNFAHGD
jgi:hypothetical protein